MKQDRTGVHSEPRTRRSGLLRRAVRLALVCLLVPACAMAAGPGFRQAVLSFLRLGQDRQVRTYDLTLEGEGWTYQDGLLFRTEGKRMPEEQFYTVDKNGLSPAETHKLRLTGSRDGQSYDVELLWARGTDGIVCWDNSQPDGLFWNSYRISSIPGPAEAVVLRWRLGSQTFPMLVHLDTGEVEDMPARFDLEQLDVEGFILSPDLKYALAFRRADKRYRESSWLLDLEAGTIERVLEDAHADIASFYFADSRTLIALSRSPDLLVDCWVYHIDSGETVQTVKQEYLIPAPEYPLYLLSAAQDGTAAAVDLRTGTRTPLEGFVYQNDGPPYLRGVFDSSPLDGKLLYSFGFYESEEDKKILFDQMGILDPAAGTFVPLDLEGCKGLAQGSAGWLDSRRVIVWDSRGAPPQAGEHASSPQHFLRIYEV